MQRDRLWAGRPLGRAQVDLADVIPAVPLARQALHLGAHGLVGGLQDESPLQRRQRQVIVVGAPLPNLGLLLQVAMSGNQIGGQQLIGLHPFLPGRLEPGRGRRAGRCGRLGQIRRVNHIQLANIDLTGHLVEFERRGGRPHYHHGRWGQQVHIGALDLRHGRLGFRVRGSGSLRGCRLLIAADEKGQPPQVGRNVFVLGRQAERIQVGAEGAHPILDLVFDQGRCPPDHTHLFRRGGGPA